MFFLTELQSPHPGTARWEVQGASRLFSPWLGRWLHNLPIWYIPVGRPTSLPCFIFHCCFLFIFFLNTFFSPTLFPSHSRPIYLYFSPDGLSWVTNLFTWLKRSSFVRLPPTTTQSRRTLFIPANLPQFKRQVPQATLIVWVQFFLSKRPHNSLFPGLSEL